MAFRSLSVWRQFGRWQITGPGSRPCPDRPPELDAFLSSVRAGARGYLGNVDASDFLKLSGSCWVPAAVAMEPAIVTELFDYLSQSSESMRRRALSGH